MFDPLRFGVLRAPGYADPGWADTAVAMIAAHADELADLAPELPRDVVHELMERPRNGLVYPRPVYAELERRCGCRALAGK